MMRATGGARQTDSIFDQREIATGLNAHARVELAGWLAWRGVACVACVWRWVRGAGRGGG